MNIASRTTIYAVTLGCLLFPVTGMSATLEEIDQRLKKLESDVSISREETDDLDSRFRNNMSVTGYADVEYITTNENGKDDGFRIHHLSMFLKKQISEKWRFFSEIEYEDGPFYEPSKASNVSTASVPAASGVPDATTVGSGKIFAEAVNFDFQWRPDTSLRAGRFFTPAGLWSVDHYPPFVATQERPQHIRLIFPQLVDGAAISGNHPIGKAFVNYDLYIGNGETTRFDGAKDSNSTKAAGLRFAVSLPIAQQFELGATLYRDKLASAADANKPEKDARGFHAKVRLGGFGYQAEYADGSYKPTVLPGNNLPYHRKGFYNQISYDVSSWTLGYRYDYYDPSTIKSNDVKRFNSVFANYHVSKNIVLKLEHHLVDQEDPTKQDYYKNLASIAVNLD